MELAIAAASPLILCKSTYQRLTQPQHYRHDRQRMPLHLPRLNFTEKTLISICQSSSTDRGRFAAPAYDDEASAVSMPTSNDLLVIGPGVLGRLIAAQWMKDHPGCKVIGQTNTTTHHVELLTLGIKPVVKGLDEAQCFPYVVFCAPPSGSMDYPGELRLAGMRWDGTGSFLFTSSSGIYDCGDNDICDEDCPIVPLGSSPRMDNLLKAESEVLRAGGTILRLAGLYSMDRGPHTFWAKKGSVDSRPGYTLNLIHYEDAASLSVVILKKGFRNQVFLGCDNHPLSRKDVMDIVLKSGKLEVDFKGFTGTAGPLGKRMNCSKTQVLTGWQPKYGSFSEFFGIST